MKLLLTGFAILFSLSALAVDKDFKHQITFGNDNGFGWSGSGSTADTDSKLGIDEFEQSAGKLNLNYAYRIASHFQLGLAVMSDVEKSEIKYVDDTKTEATETSTGFYIFGTFNFSEELQNSFYITAAIGKEKFEKESKDEDGKIEVEYDVTGYVLEVGKRFALDFMNIENLTYSPSISFHHGEAGGDIEEAGVNSLTQVTLDVIKFDLLF